MIKRLLLITLLIVSFFSCVKDDDLQMDFKITGVNPVSVVRGYNFPLNFKIYYLGGDKTDVTVKVDNIPAGFAVSLIDNTGEPDFSMSGTVSVNSSVAAGVYTLTVTGTSEEGNVMTKDLVVTVKDPANHYPTLQLAGSTNLTVTLNDPYAEPGYYASDPEDGDITSNVIVTGSVNPDSSAVYKVRYVVYDSDGDSAWKERRVTVLNENSYMQGSYNCTTSIQNGITFQWTADIEPSLTQNNVFILNKISNCFGTPLSPLRLKLFPTGVNGLVIPPQVFYGSNTNNPAQCDAAFHTFSGGGTVSYTMPYTFEITYLDQYEDSNGVLHTYTKTDTYVKTP